MIGYWHHHVIRLSVTLYIVALVVGVQGYDNTPFWIPATPNKDDLECPVHLKVRLAARLTYVCYGFRIRP